MNKKKRCSWLNLKNPLYVEYHDKEWGRPVYDDTKLFEMLILEGAQAGLSWETILKKRKAYRRAFANFDPKKVARFSTVKVKKLMQDEGIVRNRLKIESSISNAQAFLKVQKEQDFFHNYLWSFMKNCRPVFTHFSVSPQQTQLSDVISKDLKKKGFSFVGSTIVYAYIQAVGLVQAHSTDCYLFGKNLNKN